MALPGPSARRRNGCEFLARATPQSDAEWPQSRGAAVTPPAAGTTNHSCTGRVCPGRLPTLERKPAEQIEGIVRAGIAAEAVIIALRPIEFQVGDILQAQAHVEPRVPQCGGFAKRDHGHFRYEAATGRTTRRAARERRGGIEAGIRPARRLEIPECHPIGL